MFNRRPESSSPAALSPVAPLPPKIPKSTGETVFSPSAYANTAGANYSIINEWLTMKGDLESEADILVKGKVFGNIRCKLLIVDASARVEGGIEADEVIVRGATKGTILAKRVRLEKTADVDSEIQHGSFAADEGARIRGALKFSDELAKAAASHTAAASSSVVVQG